MMNTMLFQFALNLNACMTYNKNQSEIGYKRFIHS